MDKIKKQFKDFWTYCRLLRYGANANDRANVRRFLPFVIAVTVCSIIILSQMSAPSDSLRFSMFMPFLCAMSIATGAVTAYRPSLISVAPYTPGQRIVFSYLATLLRAIIVTIIWTVAMITFMLFLALIVFAFTGENVLIAEGDEVARVISAYGNAHSILVWFIFAFSAYAISHLNSRKVRNIVTATFIIGLEILVLILVNACGYAKQNYDIAMGINDGVIEVFFFGSNVAVTIDYLAHPWVVIVVEAVLCAAAIAASVYCSVLRYKSSKI